MLALFVGGGTVDGTVDYITSFCEIVSTGTTPAGSTHQNENRLPVTP